MPTVTDLFGSMVFSDSVMRSRLPKETYKALRQTIKNGEYLDKSIAPIVASVMKEWAVEKGATHFTHWFQPMTGITAEKHDSFISPTGDGHVIMEFSGKELTKGEADGSSFPSGGLRATFEARGYTAWDPTSYAFVRDGVLFIPTAFCSYGGEALDNKTPLLRSMETLNKHALRILRLFGKENVSRVIPTVGSEQEYFLVDKTLFERRKDLIFTGRTLFGAKAPKGQELDDHYYGSINSRVASFMKELDEELWKLGVLAKTEHNEAAPAQHELAPIFTTANIACDQNQLTMDLMQRIAGRHGLVCLLHEKPFAGVNGSGKHNNWSLSSDTGVNLLEPGETPSDNAQFLLLLCAVIKAVDEYQDLLRISVTSAGNDHRLGGNEAPPAIVSIYLGSELEAVLNAVEHDETYCAGEKRQLKVGVHSLPRIPQDSTDRNRTSPFAFTGNKFEFRMPGSSASISEPNIVLNTVVAEELRQFADTLEAAEDFESALHELIKTVITEHKRIIFSGNGYGAEWQEEAEKRGLRNLSSTPECLAHLLDEKNVELFERHRVFSKTEMYARCDIMLENYAKVIGIEARTMADMVMQEILPAVSGYTGELAERIRRKKELDCDLDCTFEAGVLSRLSILSGECYAMLRDLQSAIAATAGTHEEIARYCRNELCTRMEMIRACVDEMEVLTEKSVWPIPGYSELLFSIR